MRHVFFFMFAAFIALQGCRRPPPPRPQVIHGAPTKPYATIEADTSAGKDTETQNVDRVSRRYWSKTLLLDSINELSLDATTQGKIIARNTYRAVFIATNKNIIREGAGILAKSLPNDMKDVDQSIFALFELNSLLGIINISIAHEHGTRWRGGSKKCVATNSYKNYNTDPWCYYYTSYGQEEYDFTGCDKRMFDPIPISEDARRADERACIEEIARALRRIEKLHGLLPRLETKYVELRSREGMEKELKSNAMADRRIPFADQAQEARDRAAIEKEMAEYRNMSSRNKTDYKISEDDIVAIMDKIYRGTRRSGADKGAYNESY